jgi:Arm DNA-binding domain
MVENRRSDPARIPRMVRGRSGVGSLAESTMDLTDEAVARLDEPGRYRDAGRGAVPGLFFQISRAGGKSWVFRYKWAKRDRMLGLGKLSPVVNLTEARKRAKKAIGEVYRAPRTIAFFLRDCQLARFGAQLADDLPRCGSVYPPGAPLSAAQADFTLILLPSVLASRGAGRCTRGSAIRSLLAL